EAVVDAVGSDRPAIVLAGLGDVDLVPPTRAVLMSPELAGPGIERGALLIAVTVGPDLRARIVAANEGVVIRDAPIRIQSHHLALQLVQILRSRPLVVLTQGDEQIAVTVEHQSRAK